MTEENKGYDGSLPDPILIKKYPNRRLYNTKSSSYIVLDDIVELIKSDTPFIIEDKKTGEDITRSILNQIIFDRETANPNSHYHFPLEVQKQLIGMYDDAYSQMVPDFLKQSLNLFQQEQDKMQSTMKDLVEKNSQMMMEASTNMARHNMELFKKSMDLFATPANASTPGNDKTENKPETKDAAPSQLDEIQEQINALQERLKQLK